MSRARKTLPINATLMSRRATLFGLEALRLWKATKTEHFRRTARHRRTPPTSRRCYFQSRATMNYALRLKATGLDNSRRPKQRYVMLWMRRWPRKTASARLHSRAAEASGSEASRHLQQVSSFGAGHAFQRCCACGRHRTRVRRIAPAVGNHRLEAIRVQQLRRLRWQDF